MRTPNGDFRSAKRSLKRQNNLASPTVDRLLKQAKAHHCLGQLSQAEALYRQILQLSPNHRDALHLLGVTAHQAGKYTKALELIDRAILLRPDSAEAYADRGNALERLGQYEAAVESFNKAILLKPDFAQAYNNRGSALHRLQQYGAALENFDKAIQLKSDFAQAYNNRGSALHGLQQSPAAVESFNKAIQLKPDFAEAYNNRGNAFYDLEQHQAALESFDKAIQFKPDFAEAYNNRGNALQGLQQHQAALENFDKAIQIKPQFAKAYNNRGNTLYDLQQYQTALESFDKAIELEPEFAEVYYNRGNVLRHLHQYQTAVQSFDSAIQLKPGFAQAYNNRGNALRSLQQNQAALESFEKAIQLKPEFADAYNNGGITLIESQQYQAALESFDKVIQLKPQLPEGYINRGNALQGLRQFESARESFDMAFLLRPNYEYLPGTQLQMKQVLCDWEGIDSQRQRLEANVDRNEKVVTPFVFLTLSASPALQKKAAETYMRDKYLANSTVTLIPHRPRQSRIRIGYFSTDYYNHATSYLMAELFERHDRSRFEVLGFSFGPDIKDEMSQRVSAAMDRFIDVRSMSDEGVAQLSRQLEMDIAVDLKGFTRDCRSGIFAQRAAPIQVSYLGFPATTGTPYMDYLIADHALIPEASQRYYSEKIVYLPNSYQVNDSKRLISTRPYTRAEEGLPERGFVYCCFNNNYKITPEVFDIWMSILVKVEGSVLWLLEGNPRSVDNLRQEAVRRGISPQRLIFAKGLPLAEHLARHSLADLFLDTFPCNAHTTASDALWAGLPVLTRMGETFASRVAASLLGAIDLPELVTTTEAAYERLALELAFDRERYQEIRKRLQRNRLTSPLFDLPSSTKHLEAAYSAMYERYQAGLSPDHIQVAGLPN
jgi:protein O-GlcNAc transferase